MIPWAGESQGKFWSGRVTSRKGKFGEDKSNGCEGWLEVHQSRKARENSADSRWRAGGSVKAFVDLLIVLVLNTQCKWTTGWGLQEEWGRLSVGCWHSECLGMIGITPASPSAAAFCRFELDQRWESRVLNAFKVTKLALGWEKDSYLLLLPPFSPLHMEFLPRALCQAWPHMVEVSSSCFEPKSRVDK